MTFGKQPNLFFCNMIPTIPLKIKWVDICVSEYFYILADYFLFQNELRKSKSFSHTSWTVAYRLLHPWNFPGKGTGVGCHFLLQGFCPIQGLNPGLPHCKQTLYRLSHQGSILADYFLFQNLAQHQNQKVISCYLKTPEIWRASSWIWFFCCRG